LTLHVDRIVNVEMSGYARRPRAGKGDLRAVHRVLSGGLHYWRRRSACASSPNSQLHRTHLGKKEHRVAKRDSGQRLRLTLQAWRCRGNEWLLHPTIWPCARGLADAPSAPWRVCEALARFASPSPCPISPLLNPCRWLPCALCLRISASAFCLSHLAFRSPTALASSAPPDPPAPPLLCPRSFSLA
jgi:hypothetical protein